MGHHVNTSASVSPCGGHLSRCRTKRPIHRSFPYCMYVLSRRNVVIGVAIPWMELRSCSVTPSVDGSRGIPNLRNMHIKIIGSIWYCHQNASMLEIDKLIRKKNQIVNHDFDLLLLRFCVSYVDLTSMVSGVTYEIIHFDLQRHLWHDNDVISIPCHRFCVQ